MPPKSSDPADKPGDAILPVQEWLKLLTGRGVDMRAAMTLAAKMYSTHNTKDKLSTLDAKALQAVLPDKEARKAVLNAVKGIASGSTFKRKRGRDSDLLQPLQPDIDSEPLPSSLVFNEITDPEALIPITITVNRAPVKTAWAFIVAQRLGFDTQESLSIAHVFVHISSLKHALMLGNILNKDETREAEEEMRELPGMETYRLKPEQQKRKGKGRMMGRGDDADGMAKVGSSQPWVGIMRARIPVIERSDGTWRAIEKGVPVQPSQAYHYISKAFKDYAPHVIGALRLLAASYPPDELNTLGMHMYNAFKPDVVEWGQRGILEIAKILDQLKNPVPIEAEIMARKEAATGPEEVVDEGAKAVSTADIPSDDLNGDAGSDLSEPPPEDEVVDEVVEDRKLEAQEEEERDMFELPPLPAKRQKTDLTLEEYEALLDEEDGGGFLEGGDIAPSTAG